MSVVAIATAVASHAHPLPVTTFDLELTDLRVENITRVVDRFEIAFSFRIENVGTVAYDPDGADPIQSNDNATIQTYLSDGIDPAMPAAAGWSISDAPVLEAGDSYRGSFEANTGLLPDPLSFGAFVWLVVDLGNTGEEPEHLGNNRATVFVPSPGVGALAVIGLA